jgi:DNA modification methylase
MLDPFVGIGHSALAAKQCNIRRFIGFDIDPEYIRVAGAAVEMGLAEPTFDLPIEKDITESKIEVFQKARRRRTKHQDDGDSLFSPPESH